MAFCISKVDDNCIIYSSDIIYRYLSVVHEKDFINSVMPHAKQILFYKYYCKYCNLKNIILYYEKNIEKYTQMLNFNIPYKIRYICIPSEDYDIDTNIVTGMKNDTNGLPTIIFSERYNYCEKYCNNIDILKLYNIS